MQTHVSHYSSTVGISQLVESPTTCTLVASVFFCASTLEFECWLSSGTDWLMNQVNHPQLNWLM